MAQKFTPRDPNETPMAHIGGQAEDHPSFPESPDHGQAGSNPSPKDPGLKADIDALKSAVGRYAAARAKLFGIEAQEAGSEIGGAAVQFVIAGFFGLFFYLLLLATILGFAEHHREGSWLIAAAILGAIHFFIAIGFFIGARRRLDNPSRFAETKRQLKIDNEWLKTNTKKK